MSAPLLLNLNFGDWLGLFLHFLMLSLLAVGGAVATIPDMHRYLVDQQRWLTDPQFSGALAIAQSAPGPNILFVALMGWNVGMNAGGLWQAAMGLVVIMGAMMLPSSVLTYFATRWLHHNRGLRSVRAFKQGMAPIVIGLLLATGWVLASVNHNPAVDWPLWLVTLATALLVWLTRLHILWILLGGAALGWFHLV
ncbi:chromate transporter [Oxalobacteraceae bacterium CAVE-383]|nr:chromate transporter [Oxalobacteraceae bacterium CAVE-383]